MDKKELKQLINFVWRRNGGNRVLAASWNDLAGRRELRASMQAAIAAEMGDVEFDANTQKIDRELAVYIPAVRFIVAEETSGGTIFGQIEITDRLVWSHMYDDDQQVLDDARNAAEWADFEGGEIDDDGEPVEFINAMDTVVVLASYDVDTASWDIDWPEWFGGRGRQFLAALRSSQA